METAQPMKLIPLSDDSRTWPPLKEQWQKECTDLKEDFPTFTIGNFGPLNSLAIAGHQIPQQVLPLDQRQLTKIVAVEKPQVESNMRPRRFFEACRSSRGHAG
jgi:hypothetical protein